MATQLKLSPKTDLAHYLREIYKYPLLAAAEETALGRRWRDRGDQAAAEALVGSHLRLAVRVARGLTGYRLPLADLIAEGNVGLMEAVRRFDPDRGVRFATYAMWWIRASINDYVMRNVSIVRMGTTAAQKKLFFNLRRAKAARGELGDGDLGSSAVASIAAELGVGEDEVVAADRRLGAGDRSLNAPMKDGVEAEFQDYLVDDTEDPETRYAAREEHAHRGKLLRKAMRRLNPREKDILTQRRLAEDRSTLAILSEKYGVSRERIRQIEIKAFDKLRAAMLKQAPA